ncbi:GGDEF domain-containing protein [Pseudidiomarina sediminum]|uniref:GGDEF domain-containing protein n=1 Tax=Pseudidiomarina sediminum TaxID=431675 RepID=UPI001C948F2A|nr:GGDEF domain-containing protein [Pseudidiomarina sediminum]MBY6064483.1 GGDEF domain-containing protein [Pseudidiomarina sediminum]
MKRHPYTPWLVLLIGTLFSLLAGYLSYSTELNRAREGFLFNTQQVEVALTERLLAYELVLRGAAGFYEQSEHVSRDNWRGYTDKLRRDGAITEVQGIGFAAKINQSELTAFEQRVRAEGYADFHVRPVSQRDIYSSIVYLEPFDERNQRAFGYDMYSEPVRYHAMHRAAMTGKVALTGRVELLQENGSGIQPGTLMYVPVYDGAALRAGVERMDALKGWAYSPFRMQDLLSGILKDWEREEGASIALRVFDGAERLPAQLLYSNHDEALVNPDYLKASSPFYFGGREWLLEFRHKNEVDAIYLLRPVAIIGLGLFVTLALAAYLKLIAATRDRATELAEKLTADVRTKQRELQMMEERWRFAVEATNGGVWDWTVKPEKVYFSDGWYRLFGYSSEQVKNELSDWHDLVHPEDRAAVDTRIQEHLAPNGKNTFESEYRVFHHDGHVMWVLDRGTIVERDAEGHAKRVVGTIEDITKEKHEMRELQSAAECDKLTGLPNRSALFRQLKQLVAEVKQRPQALAVLFIDLDGFKKINDHYGHAAGDYVLREVAHRFREQLRSHDILCRLGGDEFVAVLTDTQTCHIETVLTRLIEAIRAPMYFEQNEMFIGASIGAVVHDGEVEMTATDLIRHADAAMYKVKREHRGGYEVHATEDLARST